MSKVYGPYFAAVQDVYDGDTIHVNIDLGFGLDLALRCRVFGINAPELEEQAGKDAREFALTLLPAGEAIMVVSHGWDKYGGRFDGEITLPDGRNFGDVMVQNGYAVYLT